MRSNPEHAPASHAATAPPTPAPAPPAPGRSTASPSAQASSAPGTNDLRRLRLFVALAHDPHFGRTARREHVSQPTLSAQIQRLERELGVRLFVRDGRGSRLSPAGRALLPCAVELLAHADRLTAFASRLGPRVGRSSASCRR